MTLNVSAEDHFQTGEAGGERLPNEHPSVVLGDLAGRRLPQGHVVTFANEKGGVGKSTLAFHCALALAHLGMRVLAVDCDRRQRTLGRLLEARQGTMRTLKVDLPTPKHVVLEKPCGAQLLQEIDRVGTGWDFVLIDLAGHDSPVARRAIAMAHTVVTPVNCSPTDLDALGWINPVSRRFRQAGPFAEVVAALRDERIARGGQPFDWIVAKNRVRHCEQRLIAAVDENLATMARHLDFRTIEGLTERVTYREMLPFGLSQLDLRSMPELGAPRAANLSELRRLVEGLRLPQPHRPCEAAVRPAKTAACVPPQAARSYREALSRTLPARPALA